MNKSLERFKQSIDKTRNLHNLYVHLKDEKGFEHILISDILRSEIVYAIAALDRLVHDLVLVGIIDIFSGTRLETPSYNNLNINLLQQKALKDSTIPEIELKQIIIDKHKYLAFQEPEKITNALSIINSEQHKWQVISDSISLPMNDVKVQLKNIIIRRNQIVHESDIDLLSGTELPILRSDVEEIIIFIEKIGTAIYNLVK